MPVSTELTAGRLTIIIVIGLVVLAAVGALLGHLLVRYGLREPFVVRLINKTTDRVVDTVKRPITIAVLDEVADVLEAGHYARNTAAVLQANADEIRQLVAEKVKADPTTGRIGLLPFHDRLIDEVSAAAVRVVLQVLLDPRTDRLVSDTLRDNVSQIRAAVRQRQAGVPAAPEPGGFR